MDSLAWDLTLDSLLPNTTQRNGGLDVTGYMTDCSANRMGSMSSSASTASQSPTSSASTSSSRAAVPVPKKRQRDLRRKEIVSLRAKSQELEIELAALTARQTDANSIATDLDMFLLREDVVARQEKRRRKAETHNQQLWDKLQGQLEITRQLVQVLETAALPVKRASDGGMDDGVGIRLQGEMQSHEEHLHRLDDMYLRTKDAFTAPCYASQQRVVRDVKIQGDGLGGLLIQAHVAWRVPFTRQRVADAMWQHTTIKQIQDMTVKFEHLQLSQDELTASALIETPYPLGGLYRGALATRRFSADHGEVFVCSCHIRPLPSTVAMESGGFLSLYSVTGEAWLRVESVDSRGVCSSDDSLPTRVQWTRHYRLRSLSDGRKSGMASTGRLSVESPSLVARFTDSILLAVEQDMENSQEMLEDLLVGAAC